MPARLDRYEDQGHTGLNMCNGARMPKLRAPLSDADIAKLEAWICQGALDN
jgi:cytochrome c553